MIPLDDPTTLSLLFHLNSEPWLNDEAYHRGAPSPHEELGGPGPSVALLPVDPAASCRAYRAAPLPLATVAALLVSGYGVVEVVSGANNSQLVRRTVPSAGGPVPLEARCASAASPTPR